MLITTEGIIIRIKVSDTTLLGRVTTGVKLINLKDGVQVASIAKVVEDKSSCHQKKILQKNLTKNRKKNSNKLKEQGKPCSFINKPEL